MNYTPEQYGRELDKRMQSFKDAAWFSDCAVEAWGNLVDRVFQQGLNGAMKPHEAQGKDYPVYSPGYASKRKNKGRQTGYVNLIFEGRLVQDMGTGLEKQGRDYVGGVKNVENGKKIEWLEDLYGPLTFRVSKDERAEFKNCVYKRALELLTK